MFLDFFELKKHFFTISNIFVKRQIADGKTKFNMYAPRPTDAFLLFVNTNGICYQNNAKPLYVPKGALVYMPKNSRYIWENLPADGTRVQENILFEFSLSEIETFVKEYPKKTLEQSGKIGESISFSNMVKIVSVNHFEIYKNLFENLLKAFENAEFSPLSVYCAAYEFFLILCENCSNIRENIPGENLIKSSLKYLEDCSANSKSIKEIATEYNVSLSYYERLFRTHIGISPIEHRNIYRINSIKMYLQKTEITLDEIAEKMGYCDSGYLCRIFRRKTGMTPSEYRKLYINQIKNNDLKGNLQ